MYMSRFLLANEEFSGRDDNKVATHGVTAELPGPFASAEMSGYIKAFSFFFFFDFEPSSKFNKSVLSNALIARC